MVREFKALISYASFDDDYSKGYLNQLSKEIELAVNFKIGGSFSVLKRDDVRPWEHVK